MYKERGRVSYSTIPQCIVTVDQGHDLYSNIQVCEASKFTLSILVTATWLPTASLQQTCGHNGDCRHAAVGKL